MQEAANGAASACGRTPRPTRARSSRAGRSSAAPIGICCAKLGEAEVFADAGITDIRLPYPINPVERAARARAARSQRDLSFIVDHLASRGLVGGDARAGRTVDVLVKVDVGFHRCGIDPARRTRGRVHRDGRCAAGPALRGLLVARRPRATTPRRRPTCDDRARTKRGRSTRSPTPRAGTASTIDEISAGATPTARYSLEQDGLTEYRAGNYVYFDRTQVGLGAATLDDCALTVLATRGQQAGAGSHHPGCGSKTLTTDGARGFSPLPGHGAVFRDSSRRGAPRRTPT